MNERLMAFARRLPLLPLLLLVLALQSAAYGLEQVMRTFPQEYVQLALLLGLICGWLIARSQAKPGRRTAIWQAVALAAAVVAGVLLALFFPGELRLPFAAWLRAAWMQVEMQISAWRVILYNLNAEEAIETIDLTPAAEAAGFAAQELLLAWQNLIAHLRHWLEGVSQGQAVYDRLAGDVMWSEIFWLLGLWAGWAQRRLNQPLAALAPAGLMLAAILNISESDTPPLLALLGCCTALLVWSSLHSQQGRWQTAGVDYAEDIQFDTFLTGLLLTLVLMAAGLSAEVLPKARTWISESINRSSNGSVAVAQALGIEPQNQAKVSALGGISSGDMPRQHLLGAAFELMERPVFSVRLLQSAPPTYGKPLYWRALTYDIYNGRGWESSPLEEKTFNADNPLPGTATSMSRRLLQEVSFISYGPTATDPRPAFGFSSAGKPILLLAAGEPILSDKPLSAGWRSIPTELNPNGETDFFAAQVEGTQYVVESRLTDNNPALLASSSSVYPEWIRQRYLALPPDMPPRVSELARELTAEADNVYEKALILEEYLRSFPYTLDLDAPPEGVDVVEYYLFDLRRGYCDYSASAMTVLARAAGIPARLAVGYAGGIYDEANGRFVVREKDAHSWSELYFSGLGWVAFEPTGGREKETNLTFSTPQLELPPNRQAPDPLFLLGLGVVLGIVILWLSRKTLQWYDARLSPFEKVERAYLPRRRQALRMLREKTWQTATPLELADGLQDHLQILSLDWPGQAEEWRNCAADFRTLSENYMEAVYSSHHLQSIPRRQARRLTAGLSGRLRQAWFAGKLISIFQSRSEENISRGDL